MKSAALCLPFLCLSLTACLDLGTKLNPDYCGNNDGDAHCERTFGGEKSFCLANDDPCYDEAAHPTGCVAATPSPECRNECGMDEANCVDPTDPTVTESSSSTGPTTDTEPTTETETDTTGPTSETDTTGPTGCEGPADCSDAALPFCVDEACVACSSATEPDAACAELDEATPLCIEDACVQCTADDTDACDGITPLCDAEANTCVACEFHEECQDIGSPACNFVTGACFDAADVTPVNLATAGELQAAIDGVADGAEHAIIATGNNITGHAATIDGGKTIAIVSTDTNIQTIDGAAAPILTVTGADTTVFLHRIRLDGSNDVGISVEASAALFADSTRVSGNDGGGITLGAGTTGQLRNCMVGGSTVDVSAVLVNGGNLDAIYTSILGGALDSYGLRCTSGSATVRNSIVTTRGDNDALVCPGASVPNSAVENNGNPDWFSNYNAGDAHLTAAGQAQFTNIAIWEDGDPPFDFEGHARPATDGSMDFAGADTIP